ncbi:pyridoxamine 5'-phosphate oxidase [Pedobacter hiemivivus]|uniref:Pyridoxine/pyridoxamine 5'-phosphate oxidase n=1 Tax=Pedobacter hiemivivus TaxID=2530454 RepID=A0A4U1GBU6_9SPHI|nr:pyridoxamine 5'-phosphate oxidase [Pedobacter hiemivivus]TCC86193.1 pyridoxamine 5'-phosphate oxidase [Pedobacter hiemivivus]TKC58622.1 pyridoxamine 5'-phosphate oxidase [Pedobacter hiemivivus]
MEHNKKKLHDLRQEYRSAQLTEKDVESDPILQFGKWFSAAVDAQLYEPNVMTLATADRYGKPDARIVLLKEFDANGFVFYTNYESKKGQDLVENPQAALVFFWPELERQVRIEGVVSKVDAETSADYFHSRPVGSQIGAMASPQSKVLDSRESLEEKVADLTKAYENKEIPRPLHWGGYLVEPMHIEFWQGRPSRLHDRIVYDLVDGSWIINRLAP